MRHLYLFLAIAGAVVPYVFFIGFFGAEGVNPAIFLAGVFANGAAGGFAVDLGISSAVFWIFMFSRRAEGPTPWWFIFLNVTLGLSCALPAYLYASCRDARTSNTTP